MKQRSVLRHLLSNNDNQNTNGSYFYTEQKEGEREQVTGETERECVSVCVRDRGQLQNGVASVIKTTVEGRDQIGLK